MTPQGEFLLRLGIGERAKVLRDAKSDEAANIARLVERLTGPRPDGAALFKAFLQPQSPGSSPQGFRDERALHQQQAPRADPRHQPRLFRPRGRPLHRRLASNNMSISQGDNPDLVVSNRAQRRPLTNWAATASRASSCSGRCIRRRVVTLTERHAPGRSPSRPTPWSPTAADLPPARHPHRRLRAGAARRPEARGHRRRPCRLERAPWRHHRQYGRRNDRAGGGAGAHYRGHRPLDLARQL